MACHRGFIRISQFPATSIQSQGKPLSATTLKRRGKVFPQNFKQEASPHVADEIDKYDDDLDKLIDTGKEKGYLTYGEVNDLLPGDITSP